MKVKNWVYDLALVFSIFTIGFSVILFMIFIMWIILDFNLLFSNLVLIPMFIVQIISVSTSIIIAFAILILEEIKDKI